jgi:hypothetical protein
VSNNTCAADLTPAAFDDFIRHMRDSFAYVPQQLWVYPIVIPCDETLRDYGWSDAEIAELKRLAVSA